MNIVIPLAGKDERFESRSLYKPFVQVEGRPLIQFCIDSLGWPFKTEKSGLFFIILKEHDEKFGAASKLKALFPAADVFVLEKPTDGAACTVLRLKDKIDNDEELVVYLADIYFKGDVKAAIDSHPNAWGVIPTFKSSDKKYSYAIAGTSGKISSVAEKRVISDNASAGFYYFRKGHYFVSAVEEMIAKNDRANNAFYICPAYNYVVGKGEAYIAPVDFVFDMGKDDFIRRHCGK